MRFYLYFLILRAYPMFFEGLACMFLSVSVRRVVAESRAL